jgi:AcrR family transcriptional regulator
MKEIKNKKFLQIVNTSKTLFWKFGINRVTIEEICKDAKVSKMTFYKFFKNKTELVKYLLEKLTNDTWEQYYAIMDKEISYPEKVKQTIELKMNNASNLSSEIYKDFYKNADPELRRFFNELSTESLKKIRKDYIKAQKEGNIRKDINPDFILYTLNFMLDKMAKDENLISMYPTPGDLIYELINFFFYGIMPRNDENK